MSEKQKVFSMKEVPSLKDFSYPLLVEELAGQDITIEAVRIGETEQFGEYAIVTVKDKGLYRTTSEVLLKQLKEAMAFLENNKNAVLNGTIEEKKTGKYTYYTF